MFLDKNKQFYPYIFWLLGQVILTVTFFLAIFLSALTPWLSLIVLFLIGLFFIIYGVGSEYLRRVKIVSCILGVIIMVISTEGFAYQDYQYLEKGKTLKNISIEEVIVSPEITKYYFNDGKILLDKLGENIYESYSYNSDFMWIKYSHYYVFPLVSENWDENKPINVWVTCYGQSEVLNISLQTNFRDCLDNLKNNYQAGLKLYSNDLYLPTIKKAEETYGIKSSVNPLLITWMENPDAYVADTGKFITEALLTFNLYWLVVGVLGILIDFSIILFKKYYAKKSK